MTKRPRDLFGNPVRPPREDAIHAAIVEFLCLCGTPRLLWFHSPEWRNGEAICADVFRAAWVSSLAWPICASCFLTRP